MYNMKLFNYVQLREKMMLTDSSHSCIISKHGQRSVLNTLLITKINFIKYFIILKNIFLVTSKPYKTLF